MKTQTTFKLVLLFAMLMMVVPGYAASLDRLKADGLVGERADGYLGAVNEPVSAQVAAVIEEINTKRKAEYTRIASANDISLKEVEALAGKKTLKKTQSGGWIFVDGWQRKP